MTDIDSVPRQHARTQRLTLGQPRNIVVSPDGMRVVFCRSASGSDPVNCLWVHDVASGEERCIADPRTLLSDSSDETLPPEERSRRERAREGAGGVVAFATDAAVTVAAFALSGRLFVAGLMSGAARELRVHGPVFDPLPDPSARRVAYVSGATLRVAELDGSSWELAGDDIPDVTWGSAEFIAAEEMGRMRGYWWAPDGNRVAVTRVDHSPIETWYIADPAHPDREPTAIRYPAAGTANADVSLHVLDLSGGTVQVEWNNASYPYLARVSWVDTDRLLLTVQSRDQKDLAVYMADASTGITRELWRDIDDAWVELIDGSPAWINDVGLVSTSDWGGTRRLLIDGEPVTPASLDLRDIDHVGSNGVLFRANDLQRPSLHQLWRWSPDGALECLVADRHVVAANCGGATLVVRSGELAAPGTRCEIITDAGTRLLPSNVEAPLAVARATILDVEDGAPCVAVVMPRDHRAGTPLPVIVDSYGGPHAQRVTEHHDAYVTCQWLADQGYAVVVIDGRGTPGRGSEWDRAVHLDLATAVLEDQVAGLHRASQRYPDLDLSRVAIRGWSFGGYLAALAVIRRPDVFHAAIAGAPVTEWRLYDTHYTERYLGDPQQDAGPYDRSSLLFDAGSLTRPLQLIHGLADDNVVSAHTLQLSTALLAAGRPHEVLPLSGVSHMTPQEVVAENLLRLQLDFLDRHLRPSRVATA